MNKTELIAEVAKKCGISKKDAEKAVTTTFDTIADALSQGDKVQLVGFGGFETKKREARMGRNPKTKEAIEIPATTIPVFKYLVDPQMLGVSNSMIYQLTDYIGYDILLQYIQELIQQARAMVATGNYDEAVIGHINDNMNDATRQIAAFQSQVQVQQDALLVVDRQMSYMRQQLSARMLSRYQNNYHFGGSTR